MAHQRVVGCCLSVYLLYVRYAPGFFKWKQPGSPTMTDGPFGVEPKVIKLPNGLLVISTGRQGQFLWVADDPPAGVPRGSEKRPFLQQKLPSLASSS